MWLRLRKTARRGRSAVPRTFLRMRLCTPRLISAFVVCAITLSFRSSSFSWLVLRSRLKAVLQTTIYLFCRVSTYRTCPRSEHLYLYKRPAFGGGLRSEDGRVGEVCGIVSV